MDAHSSSVIVPAAAPSTTAPAHFAPRATRPTWAYFVIGGLTAIVLILGFFTYRSRSQGSTVATQIVAAKIFFQIATVAGSLVVVNDYMRRRDRYRELHRMLVRWDKQLELSQTWPIVLRIASTVEKALLAELIEWRSHIRNQKLPQK